MKKDELFRSILFSVVIFAFSLVANYYAGVYAAVRANNSVTDIILSNIPVFDVDFIFVYGALALIAVVIFLILKQPLDFPFVVKSLALLIIIRAIFVSMTHLGPFPTQMPVHINYFNLITSGSDLFFSGHTGIPFMLALIYWKDIKLRLTFLIWSIVFAVIVLLGHLHYTIDVAAAFFITYTVYRMSLYVFRKDYKHFTKRIEPTPIF